MLGWVDRIEQHAAITVNDDQLHTLALRRDLDVPVVLDAYHYGGIAVHEVP